MKKRDVSDSIVEAAHDAIDEDELARVLELATGEGYDSDAVAALHAVTAHTLAADALAASSFARRRGRVPTGDDVGDAADTRRTCCEPDRYQMEPLSAKVEW